MRDTYKILLYLKWFLIPRGTTNIVPKYLQGHLSSGYKHFYNCVICNKECLSMRKLPNPPVCISWKCFKEYFEKESEEKNNKLRVQNKV